MNKAIFLLTSGLLTTLTAQAQLPIERLDSFATEIRKIEHAAHDSIYNDGKNDYFIRFAEESFGFSYADGKGWKAVDKTNITTFTCITENIDLSLANGMVIDFKDKSAAAVRLYFPDSALKTTVYAESKEPYMLYENKLEFFFPTQKEKPEGEEWLWEKMFFMLGDLVLRAQENKGMVTRQDAIAQTEALKTINPPGFSTATHDDFLEKYPNSIYKLDVINMRAQREKKWSYVVKRNSGTYGDKGQMKVYAKGYDFVLSSQGKEYPLSTKNYTIYYYTPDDVQVSFNSMNDGSVMMQVIIKGEEYYFDKVQTD